MKDMMQQRELMDDSKFEEIRDMPHYEEKGFCDDCVDTDRTLKPVRRVDGDGLCFCSFHWKNVEASFYGTGEFYEPWHIQ